ncbi:hypothetical protein B0H15DRAFT_854837 [Mycena belliarum]|uniref:IBR domain-containing protein n=1 Tax=Mycena belliarum TaxID=1033014 RepID=A0AAD6U011_9AGAR|nr:hypothetical protein B0H15DRAFT_872742 [Mycena belliae]KAJ7081350.1 hypothetical protein B0H15DRAFT_854837 [Mycena belliae]
MPLQAGWLFSDTSCKKAFIKVEGCNVITCPTCHATSCYSCRSLITNGHAHFTQSPQCNFIEDSAKMVKAAAKKALAEYRRAHPDIDTEKIEVDLTRPAAQKRT